MAVKKIRGQSKLAQKSGEKMEPTERLDLVAPKKKPTLKAYRLYSDDIARLQEITEKMNRESHRHISETAAIRALIVLGAGSSGEKLLRALRETL